MIDGESKSINKQHIIDQIIGDFVFYEDPNLLKPEYKNLFNPSLTNHDGVKKYTILFSSVRYAWQKTLRYKDYFQDFYPSSESKIDKIEALNHHIHAYLEDMSTMKNKMEVLLGEMKNDIKKIADNKKDIEDFFKTGIETTRAVFSSVSEHRGEHRHRGMRFMDGDLLKAESGQMLLSSFSNPVFKEILNKAYKPELITKVQESRDESFNVAKDKWVKMAEKNDIQTTGYLDSILNAIRPSLYQFLNIEPIHDIIAAAEKNKHE